MELCVYVFVSECLSALSFSDEINMPHALLVSYFALSMSPSCCC